MNSNELLIATGAYFLMSYNFLKLKRAKKVPRRRRWWMVSLNRNRTNYGGTELLAELLKEPSGQFHNFCRMSNEDFEFLLEKIEPYILKKDTKWRKAIPVKVRLLVTLRFLATGDSYQSLHYLFKISPQVISLIVPDVCIALIEVLQELQVVKIPSSAQEWLEIAKGFEERWQFPHCLGACDGKHIIIQSPVNSASTYYNYKGTFSIVLMALVDSNYCFTFADIGCQGRISDGGVFANSLLYEKIYGTNTNLPQDAPLPGMTKALPYVIVADDAFALGSRLMKPYSGVQQKGSRQRIFNYRLSRARILSENVFGIMASVFRVLRKPMLLQPEKARLITMACVFLHNFLRKSRTSQGMYTPPGALDYLQNDGELQPASWRQDQQTVSLKPLEKIPRKSSRYAAQIRDEFSNYFMQRGRVEWQDKYC